MSKSTGVAPTWKCRCDSCGRDVEARYEILEQRICNACYSRLRRNAAPCPACAQMRILAFRSRDGDIVCAACAGEPSRFGCARCGSEEYLTGSHCGRCRLEDRLGDVLADSNGRVPQALAPLREHLLSARDPRSAVRWLRREPIDRTLRAMARGEKPISHDTVNELPQSTRVRYFRRMLIAAGTLPAIDVRLNDLEIRSKAFIDTLPAEQAVVVTRFFNWETLRKLRRRPLDQPISVGMANVYGSELRKIAAFLAWLDENDLDLPTLEQVAVDRYLAHHDPNITIRRFLNWAARHRVTGHTDVPRSQSTVSPASMDEEALWKKVDVLLQDESTSMSSRIIGLFLLVFAQPIRDSVRLRREDVQLTGEHVKVQFGATPIILPPPIADLLTEHLDVTRDRRPYVGVSPGWLFEGVMPGQHLSEASVRFNLHKHELHARDIKRARLDHLVQVLPASIVADITGIAVNTAIRHSANTGAGWGAYPELRRHESELNTNE